MTVTGRGYRYLDEFSGATPADQLRNAFNETSQAIVPLPGTVIDVGDNPIPLSAGKVLEGFGGPQNEFAKSWPVYFKGGPKGIFRIPDNGSNYAGNKGWGFYNIGFESQSSAPLIGTHDNANQLNYAGITGCSFDGFWHVIDGPCLGLRISGDSYTNNTKGPFSYRIKGSDCQLWTDGGKLDFGGGGTDPNKTCLILSWLEKSYIGPLYITGSPARALLCEGPADRNGVVINGMVMEGRNAGAPSAGAVARITGGGYGFLGCSFNFALPGRGEQGTLMVSGGDVSLTDCRFKRANGQGDPDVYQSGGIVDVKGARLYAGGDPRQIRYRRAGGNLLASDNTVLQIA